MIWVWKSEDGDGVGDGLFLGGVHGRDYMDAEDVIPNVPQLLTYFEILALVFLVCLVVLVMGQVRRRRAVRRKM